MNKYPDSIKFWRIIKLFLKRTDNNFRQLSITKDRWVCMKWHNGLEVTLTPDPDEVFAHMFSDIGECLHESSTIRLVEDENECVDFITKVILQVVK